jgi:hypothetical protein
MEFIEEILDKNLHGYKNNVPQNITDLVFLEIEKHFMSEYLHACSQSNNYVINSKIGKIVRIYWDLNNLGRCYNPKSKLIQSYELHE